IIKQFKTIGIIFITNYILITILDFVFKIHSEQAITSSTNFSESILNKLSAPMGSLIIGFFFLVLSQVFKVALKQKQENELTNKDIKSTKLIPNYSIGMYNLISLYAIFSTFDIITLWT